jgi:hypothetical protein
MTTDQTTMPPSILRCNVDGCRDEIAVRVGGEQSCYRHAIERGNEIRAERGLPPVSVDERGCVHVIQ